MAEYKPKNPMVQDAKDICERWLEHRERLGACPCNGSIVIWLYDQDPVGAASYSETKAICADNGKLLDDIADFIQKRTMRICKEREKAAFTEHRAEGNKEG